MNGGVDYFSYAWAAISNVLDNCLYVATHLDSLRASWNQDQMVLFLICVVACTVKWTMGKEMENASLTAFIRPIVPIFDITVDSNMFTFKI